MTGGIDLACEWAGIETVAFCEREPFPQKLLRKHWPNVPIYDDVCTLTKERLDADGIGTIELIHGGYPCQPFSLAGQREGTNDDRHLWPEVFRLIQAIQPRWFVGENVAGHITLGLDTVLSDLDSIGYHWETFVIPAAGVGARHRRERVFIVAYSNSVRDNSQGKHRIDRGWQEEMQKRFESFFRPSDQSKIFPNTEGKQDWWIQQPSFQPDLRTSCENVSNPNNEGLQRGQKTGNVGRSGQDTEQQFTGHDPLGNGWATEPPVGRVANGIPQRVDRLKALGNAVVPQQIYPILVAIKQIDDMLKEEIT